MKRNTLLFAAFLFFCSCATPGGFFSGTFVLKVGELSFTDKNGQSVSQEKSKYEWIFSYDKNVASEQQRIAKQAEKKIIGLRKSLKSNKISAEEYNTQNEKLSSAMENLQDTGRDKLSDDGYNSLAMEKEFIDAWDHLKTLVK